MIDIAYYTLLAVLLQFLLFKYTALYNLNLFFGLYKNKIEKNKDIKILILGSSHGKSHIIPKEIASLTPHYKENEILNLSKVAAGSFETYRTYLANIDSFPNVEKVYISFTPQMYNEKFYLYYPYEKNLLNYRQWRYLFQHHRSYLRKFHHIRFNYFFVPIVLFIKSLFFVHNSITPFKGYQPRTYQPAKLNRYHENNIRNYICEPLSLFGISEFLVEKLHNLLQTLEHNKIETYIVISPTYNNFSSLYKDQLYDFDAQLIRSLNNKIPSARVIGSLFDKDFALSRADFYDDTHLSHSGAVKFTRALFHHLSEHKNIIKNTPFAPLYSYRSKEPPTIFDNAVFMMQSTFVLNQIQTLKKEYPSIILYGYSTLCRLILSFFPEYPFIVIDTHAASNKDYPLHTPTYITEKAPHTPIIITALGYEHELLPQLKQLSVSETPIIDFSTSADIDSAYLKVQLTALVQSILFLSKEYKCFYLSGKSEGYKRFIQSYLKPDSVIVTNSLSADKIILSDIGDEREGYTILRQNTPHEKIHYFTL